MQITALSTIANIADGGYVIQCSNI